VKLNRLIRGAGGKRAARQASPEKAW